MIFRNNVDRKEQSKRRIRSSQTTVTFLGTAIFVVMFIISGCGDDDPASPQLKDVVDVIISPDSAEFSVGEQMQFSAFVLTEAGDTIATEDLDIEWEGEWWSSDPDVFTVEQNGFATGQNPGEAFCIVALDLEDDQVFSQAGFLTKKSLARFTGRDSAFVLMLN